jgi:hypothetical protein
MKLLHYVPSRYYETETEAEVIDRIIKILNSRNFDVSRIDVLLAWKDVSDYVEYDFLTASEDQIFEDIMECLYSLQPLRTDRNAFL